MGDEGLDPEVDDGLPHAFVNASARVKPETGTVTVTRSYVTSSAGDQGNGWYVTDKAATARGPVLAQLP